jgi:hypothetical protein
MRGRIVRVVTAPRKFTSYTVRASRDEPQSEFKSDTTDHIAVAERERILKRGRS